MRLPTITLRTPGSIVLALQMATAASFAASQIDLPKSGQQSCYDESGASVSCGGTGQDGDHQAGIELPDPRFVVHGDGTFTDRLTGLMWLQDANCASTVGHDPDGTGTGEMSWTNALTFVDGINDGTFAACQAGHTDWRLPNVNELLSLTTYSNLAPALGTGHPVLNLGLAWGYWSSTSSSSNGAWEVSFYFGNPSRNAKAFWNHYAWPVRGTSHGRLSLARTGQTACFDENGDPIPCAGSGQDGETQHGAPWPDPRFVDNGDGTLTDRLTGLMWLQDLNCASTVGYDPDLTGDGRTTWQHALDFVLATNGGSHPTCAAGYSDWRLPNPIEITSLASLHDADPSTWLLAMGFTNLYYDWTWTSTTVAGNPIQEWLTDAYIFHPSGGFAREPKSENHPFWLVRSHLPTILLFVDGFESGDPSRWSSAIGTD